MPTSKRSFLEGLSKVMPIIPGVIPFGLITGTAMADAGFPAPAALAQSALIFAGASQLAMTSLFADGALPLVIVATALVINLRMAMYSAAIGLHLRDLSPARRWVASYLLTDQAFGLSIIEYARRPGMGPTERFWLYMGTGLSLWIVWQIVVAAGYFLGAGVPESWGLDFAIPLTFMAMLVPALTDRPGLIAAAVGGAVALVGHGLPFNLGLMAGAVSGIAAGVIAETRAKRRETPR